MPTFRPEPLIDLSRRIFEAAGVPTDDADIVARSLVDANLCGHDSHGVMRVPQYVQSLRDGKYKANAPLDILNETPAMIAADANWGLGQVQAHRLLRKLIDKAKILGIGAGTMKRCAHTGRLGEYAEVAAAEGLAFVGAVNSHGNGRRVAPPGGKEGRISTNPLCMGVPTNDGPIVLDIGTSVCAEGKVRVNYQKGEKVPEGWLIDAEGKATTDPGVLYNEPRGTILPIGGAQAYKGFGLGLLLDLFTGGLSGGDCSRGDFPMPGFGNTVLFTVYNPAFFGGVEHFASETSRLAQFVRDTPCAEGVEKIQLPGDPERTAKAKRSIDGISISDGTWDLITKTAKDFGIGV